MKYRFGSSIKVTRLGAKELVVKDKSLIHYAWEQGSSAVQNHIGTIWQFDLSCFSIVDENEIPWMDYRFSTYHWDEDRVPEESIEQILSREQFVCQNIGNIMVKILGDAFNAQGWTGEFARLDEEIARRNRS